MPIENYDDLRGPVHTNPHYLVVHLPGQQDSWLRFGPDELCMRAAAYYCSLHGAPAVPNESSRVVTMAQSQRFTSEVIAEMIRRSPQLIA